MTLSLTGRQFIEHWEGLELKAYNDGAGVCTIGYGHTTAAGLPAVSYGMTCTKTQADQWLASDLQAVENDVVRFVRVPLTQNQFDVLVSFHYNTGALGRSTLLHLLNNGNYSAVTDQLMLWVHGGGRVMQGLINRRAAEVKIWNMGYDPKGPPPSPPPVADPPVISQTEGHTMVDVTVLIKELNIGLDVAEKLDEFLSIVNPAVGNGVMAFLKGIRTIEASLGIDPVTGQFHPAAVEQATNHVTPGAPNAPALNG